MRVDRTLAGTLSAVTLILTVLAAPADARGRQDPGKITASIAGGAAFPVHADFDFTAAEWQIAVRGTVSPRFLLEGFLDEWQHPSEETRLGGTIQGPDGVIGTYGGLLQHTVHVTRVAGVNALFRGTIGRVSVTGGGGPAYLGYRRTFSQQLNDCQGSVPRICDGFENRFTNSDFAVQGTGGVEAPLVSRVSAFGQVKFTVSISDISGSHTSVTAGARVRVW
jgi:hypothetical protein